MVARVGVARPEAIDDAEVEHVDDPAAVSRVGALLAQGNDVLLLSAPVELSATVWRAAREVAAADPRVATVSFGPGATGGRAAGWRLAPAASGSAVVLHAVAAALAGPPATPPAGASVRSSVVDFSLRARARGLYDVVFDDPAGDATSSALSTGLADGDLAWLSERHPLVVTGLRAELDDPPSVRAHAQPRRSYDRLRVMVDDTTLGPYETGAQITTLAIVRALAARDDIDEVGVALRNGVPPYARTVMALPKVRPWIRNRDDYEGIDRYDVVHRTTQPDQGFSVAAARQCAAVVVVSVLDLIGYRGGEYFASTGEWLDYRAALRRATCDADAVTTISGDVARLIELEGWPVPPERVHPILYGTDHLVGTEPTELPRAFADGHAADEYVLCLGTDYLHKNRDVALAVHRELLARGRRPTLALAGTSVPFGGSADVEARITGDAGAPGEVLAMASVSPGERNWLLRHATVVLYPTAAEGFGLVPFEAARFGTPTVHVRFGPFRETLPERVEGSTDSWSVAELTDALAEMLDSPAIRMHAVEAVQRAGAALTWERTVAAYVDLYRALLAGS